MAERSQLIEWIRGELVGPSRSITDAATIEFIGAEFVDAVAAPGSTRLATCA